VPIARLVPASSAVPTAATNHEDLVDASTPRRPIPGSVTWITVRPRLRRYTPGMITSESDLLCPVCDRRMRVTSVMERSPGEKTFILQCRTCGLSTAQTLSGERPERPCALTS
jgi:hypothetical protein